MNEWNIIFQPIFFNEIHPNLTIITSNTWQMCGFDYHICVCCDYINMHSHLMLSENLGDILGGTQC
jgi:hypothetical protein